MWETWVWSLGQEDPLEKEMATTPVFLPEKFHGQRSLVGYSPWACKESNMTPSKQLVIGWVSWLLLFLLSPRRSNQSILKEVSPGCSLEGLMLKLKLQYFGYLMLRADSLEKTLMLGGIGAGGEGDDRGWDGWMASQTWWTWVWVNSRSWWWTGRPGVLRFMGLQRVGQDWATELNWADSLMETSW